MAVQIYNMNGTEYVAAHSELEAALAFAKHIGHSVERAVEQGYIDMSNGYPVAITASELDVLTFDDEDDEDYGKENYKPRTFREQLKKLARSGFDFPRYFAGEEE